MHAAMVKVRQICNSSGAADQDPVDVPLRIQHYLCVCFTVFPDSVRLYYHYRYNHRPPGQLIGI